MMPSPTQDEPQAAGQQAAIRAALQAYEDARMDGLCEDGAWERAAEVLRALGGVELPGESRQGETHAVMLTHSAREPRPAQSS